MQTHSLFRLLVPFLCFLLVIRRRHCLLCHCAACTVNYQYILYLQWLYGYCTSTIATTSQDALNTATAFDTALLGVSCFRPQVPPVEAPVHVFSPCHSCYRSPPGLSRSTVILPQRWASYIFDKPNFLGATMIGFKLLCNVTNITGTNFQCGFSTRLAAQEAQVARISRFS